MGVTLNEAKTSIKQARQESFNFLGYTFGPHRYKKDGHWYLGASPSKKSGGTHQGKGGETSGSPATRDLGGGAEPAESDSEGLVGYFSYGTRVAAYGRLTTTFMRAYGISCGGVTRCTRAAPTVSA